MDRGYHVKQRQVVVTANGRTSVRARYPLDNWQGLANMLAILVRQQYQEIRVTTV